MVFISGCEGMLPPPNDLERDWVLPLLHALGVPDVIGYQGTIADDVATLASEVFYAALAKGAKPSRARRGSSVSRDGRACRLHSPVRGARAPLIRHAARTCLCVARSGPGDGAEPLTAFISESLLSGMNKQSDGSPVQRAFAAEH
jgi:hypothetical protein